MIDGSHMAPEGRPLAESNGKLVPRKPDSKPAFDFADVVLEYRRAKFTALARRLDEALAGLAPGEFEDAVILRARIYLSVDPTRAIEFLASNGTRLRSKGHRARAEMLLGMAFARLGDDRAASAKFKSAASLGANDESLEAEIPFQRATAAYFSRRFDVAERELTVWGPRFVDDILLRANNLRGAIAAARGKFSEQGAILLENLRLIRNTSEPPVEMWALTTSNVAVLARDLPGTALRDAAYANYDAVPWTPDLAVFHFKTARDIGWRYALDGDYFNAFRKFKEALALAPTSAWRVTAAADRAYLATMLGEERWAEQELSDAQEAASRTDWLALEYEESIALLVLAELFAPRDAPLALSYVARYKSTEGRLSRLTIARDDQRKAAHEAYAFGIVQAALGERVEAERLLRESYATYDAIGYDWNAGQVALALAECTRDSAWKARAREKLVAYPNSWLVRERPETSVTIPEPPEAGRLTEAQRAVYDLLVRGLSTSQIAAEHGRSEFTIRNHIKAIFKVFGVNSRPALIARTTGLDRI